MFFPVVFGILFLVHNSYGVCDHEVFTAYPFWFPNPLTIIPGETVCWKNEVGNIYDHWVQSSVINPNNDQTSLVTQDFEHTFNSPGSFQYVCGLHYEMTGTIFVTAAPTAAPTIAPPTNAPPTNAPPTTASPITVSPTTVPPTTASPTVPPTTASPTTPPLPHCDETFTASNDSDWDPFLHTIHVGQTICWYNNDTINAHAVQQTTENYEVQLINIIFGNVAGHSNLMTPNQYYSFNFTDSNTYYFMCDFHNDMLGKIIVNAAPTAVPTTTASPITESPTTASPTNAPPITAPPTIAPPPTTASPTTTLPTTDSDSDSSLSSLTMIGIAAGGVVFIGIISKIVYSRITFPYKKMNQQDKIQL